MLPLVGRTLLIVSISVLCIQAGNETETSAVDFDEFFREDFQTSTLNTARWNAANMTLFRNNSRDRLYLSENVIVKDNYLHLMAWSGHSYRDDSFSRIDSTEKFSFFYGEIEWEAAFINNMGFMPDISLVQIECPVVAKNCLPALKMEHHYHDGYQSWENRTIGTVSWNATFTNTTSDRRPINDTICAHRNFTYPVNTSINFHVFKLVWLPKKLIWYVDDKEIWRETDTRKIPSVSMQKVIIDLIVTPDSDNSTNFDPKSSICSELVINYIVLRRISDRIVVPMFIIISLGFVLGFFIIVVSLYFFRKRKRQQFSREDLRATHSAF